MQHLGLLVEAFADAVATVVPHHGEAGGFCHGLDDGTDVGETGPGLVEGLVEDVRGHLLVRARDVPVGQGLA